jgi:formylglycine-generating enzyme required for sulfatase activity
MASAALASEFASLGPAGGSGRTGRVVAPETVVVTARAISYHPSGDYEQHGTAVAAPLQQLRLSQPLEITTYEVSAADYGRCVADGACKPAHPRFGGKGNVPATGVSFNDAQAYADWLSQQTGELWRLPSVAEWDLAADGPTSERGAVVNNGADPAHPWLADLDDAPAATSPVLRPSGGFGINRRGVADMGGNVWEWTSDCDSRTRLATDGSVLQRTQACGLRILEGPQRMAMGAFIQDARGGGCLASVPPDNLGFRLVRERTWRDGLVSALRGLLGGL